MVQGIASLLPYYNHTITVRIYHTIIILILPYNPHTKPSGGVIDGGTWEHRKRAKEMLSTADKNLELTLLAAGRYWTVPVFVMRSFNVLVSGLYVIVPPSYIRCMSDTP